MGLLLLFFFHVKKKQQQHNFKVSRNENDLPNSLSYNTIRVITASRKVFPFCLKDFALK